VAAARRSRREEVRGGAAYSWVKRLARLWVSRAKIEPNTVGRQVRFGTRRPRVRISPARPSRLMASETVPSWTRFDRLACSGRLPTQHQRFEPKLAPGWGPSGLASGYTRMRSVIRLRRWRRRWAGTQAPASSDGPLGLRNAPALCAAPHRARPCLVCRVAGTHRQQPRNGMAVMTRRPELQSRGGVIRGGVCSPTPRGSAWAPTHLLGAPWWQLRWAAFACLLRWRDSLGCRPARSGEAGLGCRRRGPDSLAELSWKVLPSWGQRGPKPYRGFVPGELAELARGKLGDTTEARSQPGTCHGASQLLAPVCRQAPLDGHASARRGTFWDVLKRR